MSNLDPEIQATFIGIVAYIVAWVIGKAIGAIKTYIDLKITKSVGNSKGKNNGTKSMPRHCNDHYKIVEGIAEIRTDTKWIREELANGRT